jgi:toxin-antitoxin system PIN domain toxin
VTCLLDVNVLMALLWQNHDQHLKARNWLRSITNFATCPVAQLGFARVSSHPLLGYGMSPDQAFGVLRQFISTSRHTFVPDDLSCEDRVVRSDLMRGANQVTDRYLVALARQHKIALATLDEPLANAFRNEPGLVTLVA